MNYSEQSIVDILLQFVLVDVIFCTFATAEEQNSFTDWFICPNSKCASVE